MTGDERKNRHTLKLGVFTELIQWAIIEECKHDSLAIKNFL